MSEIILLLLQNLTHIEGSFLYNMCQQIYIQSDMNEFFKTVTPECVPVELGGTLPLTIDEMTSKLSSCILGHLSI